MKKRIIFTVALAIPFALASTYAQTTRYFVYVSNSASSNVSAYAIDPNSRALSAVGGSPFAAARGPRGVAIATVTGP